jgi:NAD(P)-dependent dehydrogenase (short-subunit alcohol dehydrogenase family)
MKFNNDQWAVILGGSSGFGLATAKKLSAEGMSVCVVHRDRRGAMKNIQPEFDKIQENGNGFVTLNVNALSEDGRHEVLDVLQEQMGHGGKVRMLLHSIAFGLLKPLVAPKDGASASTHALEKLASALGVDAQTLSEKAAEAFEDGADMLFPLVPAQYGDRVLDDEDVAHTIYAMGTSLISWVQDLHNRNMFADDARIFGLTSEGNEAAFRGYAAVSAAKTALEAASRSIAVEYAPYGIRSNIIQAGVTDTPAQRMIPGATQMQAYAKARNPFQRLTTPSAVADFIALMCTDEAQWVNGTIIRVDGGERIGSY